MALDSRVCTVCKDTRWFYLWILTVLKNNERFHKGFMKKLQHTYTEEHYTSFTQ